MFLITASLEGSFIFQPFYTMPDKINSKGLPKLLIPAVVILIFAGIFIFAQQKPSSSTTRSITTSNSNSLLASAEINKTKEFQAQVSRKTTKEKIGFTIKRAELKNEIRVKDETRRAASDKAYLLLRLELQNDTTKRLVFISTDYIRMLGPDDRKYAPDFHNGAILIEPLSVRNDLVAFVVDRNQKQASFLVGELDGEKEQIDIKF